MVGAEALLSLVTENHFLSVVDVRGNLQVPNSLVAAIVQQLAENSGDSIPEVSFCYPLQCFVYFVKNFLPVNDWGVTTKLGSISSTVDFH